MSGRITLQAESADLPGLISCLARENISVANFQMVEGITAQFEIAGQDLKNTKKISARKGAGLRVISRTGVHWTVIGLLRRPVLLLGICILIALSIYLPGRVLFIRVEGNTSVPTNRILECAQQCGLSFGSYRRDLRSEKIKNGLLERISQLQWVGVNSSGCVATICVREREAQTSSSPSLGVSSIVAARDGIVLSCTGTRGNLLCKPGQAVKAGDVLISGYTDCGISIRAEQAQGDVFAQTTRSMTVMLPSDSNKKGDQTSQTKKYSLIFGKNRINFYKDSGILPSGCDKIVTQYHVVLPGGFQLPVAIVEETWYTYNSAVISVSEDSVQESMERYAQNYLLSQMLGGQILQSETVLDVGEAVCVLRGEYVCTEMIGRVRSEEIIKSNGEDH